MHPDAGLRLGEYGDDGGLGWSALHAAARHGQDAAILLLLQRGASATRGTVGRPPQRSALELLPDGSSSQSRAFLTLAAEEEMARPGGVSGKEGRRRRSDEL